MIEIKLTRGYTALIDDGDEHLVHPYSWSTLFSASTRSAKMYAKAKTSEPGTSRILMMHRLILGLRSPDQAGSIVDHIDGNGLNNTRSNLRIVTPQQNTWNRRTNYGTSKYKGVCLSRDMWQSNIQVNGKLKWLGQFASEEDAARAYDAAAREAFGEYAALNFG